MLAADAPIITDWLQAVGSIAAAVTSLVAVILTGLLLRGEIRIRRRAEEEAAASQARLVTVARGIEDSAYAGFTISFAVQNHSTEPIFDVWVTGMDPTDIWVKSMDRQHAENIGPGGRWEGDWQVDANTPAERIQVEVVFTDRNGIRWSAWHHGQLAHLADGKQWRPLREATNSRHPRR